MTFGLAADDSSTVCLRGRAYASMINHDDAIISMLEQPWSMDAPPMCEIASIPLLYRSGAASKGRHKHVSA